ncbi:uncharacterized protein B0T15DRAFT_506653 [Chaetomium strumarium]|uniref:DUF3752 domain-containing protein n=1 Tax=Chaetomium strumarium TaxID=1170767 RepID=A0AAJ0H177_9PEZI|nr:hypothetical protein B0T15DRAFT_506653 [Chaetomium strumarium]
MSMEHGIAQLPPIGPQLPPHLQKRKRSPEDDDAERSSRAPKASRPDNLDEIPLDDDSDGEYGPSAPTPASNDGSAKNLSRPGPVIGPSPAPAVANCSAPPRAEQRRSIGPSLPPTAAPANGDEILLDGSDDDTVGAAPPPKRVFGPAPPPAPLSERPPTDPDSSDDDDDDDWGPALPGTVPSTRSTTTAGSASGPTLPSATQAEPAAPRRDDWMLAPPTSNSARAPDPTKIRARKFASGPRAVTEAKPARISSIWTETPEEKARRLANAVLGREDPNNPGGVPSQSTGVTRPDTTSGRSRVDETKVRSFVEQTRGRSLVEEHQAARAAGKAAVASKGDNAKWGPKGGVDDEEDDPSKRAFDWEKDMKVGGRISHSQRKELLNRAANLGGRFQSGKYL